MSDLKTVGHNVRRKEGIPKVTGHALYADDIAVENCLYGKTVRSTVPHGYIKRISFREGIPWNEFTIVLPSDIPRLNGVTLIDTVQPFLAAREIQHIAEPVALIAHPDRDLAEQAAACVDIEVEELPAIFPIEEAMARN